MRRWFGLALSLSMLGLLVVSTPAHSITPKRAAFTPPHVVVVMMENHAAFDSNNPIVGDSNDAPYINNTLIGGCSTNSGNGGGAPCTATANVLATNWWGQAHNSLVNYVALISGQTEGLNGTNSDSSGGGFTATSLGGQLNSAGIPWIDWAESMPSACDTTAPQTSGEYVSRHNPFIYFNDVTSNPNCTSTVVPWPGATSAVNTLNGASPPSFVFLSPNLCNDMHGDAACTNGCTSGGLSTCETAGDTWLSTNLAPILASSWFTSGGGEAVVTWDEGAGGPTTNVDNGLHNGTEPLTCLAFTPLPNAPGSCGGDVPTVVIKAGGGQAGDYTVGGDHIGVLRMLQEQYGLVPAGTAPNLLPNDGNLIGALTCCPTGGGGTPAFVNSWAASNSTAGGDSSLAVTVAPSAAHLLIADLRTRSTNNVVTIASVTDNKSETWVKGPNKSSGQGDLEVWYVGSSTSGVTSITASTTCSGTCINLAAIAMTVIEVSGATGALDASGTAALTSMTPTVTSTTSTHASEFVLGDVSWNGTSTITMQSAGFTTLTEKTSTATTGPAGCPPVGCLGATTNEQPAYEISTATGAFTYGATLGASVAWIDVIATFN